MTNTTRSIDTIDNDTAIRLILDAIKDATTEITSSMQYWGNRFEWISDYDDYIPAAARITATLTERFLAHIDDTPLDALRAILDDPEFIEDMQVCDFTTPLHDFIPELDL